MCSSYKNYNALHFSVSPFPCFIACCVSHHLCPSLLTTLIKLRAFVSIAQILRAAKAAPHNKCSLSPSWPQNNPFSHCLGWFCAPWAKQTLEQVPHKALPTLQAVLQKDDSARIFVCLVVVVCFVLIETFKWFAIKLLHNYLWNIQGIKWRDQYADLVSMSISCIWQTIPKCTYLLINSFLPGEDMLREIYTSSPEFPPVASHALIIHCLKSSALKYELPWTNWKSFT